MIRFLGYRFAALLLTAAGWLIAGATLQAGDRVLPTPEVELFEGQANGQITANFVPQSEKKGTLFLSNRTRRPLTLQLPQTLGAVPVLAQVQPPQQQNRALFQQQPQRLGLAFPPATGNNIFRGAALSATPKQRLVQLPPRGEVHLVLHGVCLDFGNPTPNSNMSYKLVPLDQLTKDSHLQTAIGALAEGSYAQPAVQAVAWHLANGKSWKSLKYKFSSREMQSAQKLLEEVSSPANDQSKVPVHKSA
jgi:hypothetical protein